MHFVAAAYGKRHLWQAGADCNDQADNEQGQPKR